MLKSPPFVLIALLIIFFGFYSSIGLLRSLSPQGTIAPSAVTGFYNDSESTAIFNNDSVEIPSSLALLNPPVQKVLGEATGTKRIEVDLTNQRLYAYQGNIQVFNFLISSGLWGKTPTGIFQIWGKFRYVHMKGGSKILHDYYDLPNVPYVMFFYNDQVPKWKGFSTHGTYWHNNFGHPMSHGCINMKTQEAGLLYEWSSPDLQGFQSRLATSDNPGTQVIIYGKAPPS